VNFLCGMNSVLKIISVTFMFQKINEWKLEKLYIIRCLLQCSEDCGTGVQTRKVHCSEPGLESCDARSKPDESRACSSDKLCSGKWFTGPWGQVRYMASL
jgi:hypothetical protein